MQAKNSKRGSTFPRTRGGDPRVTAANERQKNFSPHTRGRSRPQSHGLPFASLFPAHAGVIPLTAENQSLKFAFPRTRGGDPGKQAQIPRYYDFSPHTRG